MILFPPKPRGLKGRATELAVLARTLQEAEPARLALVGAGGSGKSMLAAALAYRIDDVVPSLEKVDPGDLFLLRHRDLSIEQVATLSTLARPCGAVVKLVEIVVTKQSDLSIL